ncbi:ASCH domain-containing protein [Actinomadura sp. K4S16]|uniref:ASCH domain-containing protein n=1 Tax=Actinomadura sp. K4S16 TaxID=1316147 RepID=UPI0011EF2FA5|nr:ASCH domain-containing protein [Actinomadura sp. K4S16]
MEYPELELALPGPVRDRGVKAILSGEKTALTGLPELYERAGEAVPEAGQRFCVVDSQGDPAATIELVEVRIVPVKEIDEEYVRAEGRGYADVSEWIADHRALFQSDPVSEYLGRTPRFDDDTLVVAQHFRLVRAAGGPASTRADSIA